MEEKLKLYNTLLLVETKGGSTKVMAQCLGFLEQLIQDEQKAKAQASGPKDVA